MLNTAIFKELFYQSNLAQVIFSVEERRLEGNSAFYQFIDYDKSDEATSYLEGILEQLIEIASTKNLGEKKEFNIKTSQGVEKTGLLTISKIQYESENLFFIQISDITKRIQKERVYSLIAQHSLDVIKIHRLDGSCSYASPSLEDITGYTPSEMLNRMPCEFIYQEDYPHCEAKHKELLETKGSVLMTYRMRRKDNQYVWMESAVKAMVDGKTGNISEFISISRNIQRRMETNELMKKSDKLAVIGRMAAAVAHEIRNPLTPIKGFLQIFDAEKEYNEEYGHLILSELERVELILSEFLTLAKPHQERLETINLEVIVRKVIQLLETRASLDNKRIYFQGDETEIVYYVSGDSNTLKQVFINVIQNALDAIEANTGEILITLLAADNGLVGVNIMDNGAGIEQERIAMLGEPFYSTKEKGVGLGLMICYKIVENHKGKISITSEKGKGTNVSILFPAVQQ